MVAVLVVALKTTSLKRAMEMWMPVVELKPGLEAWPPPLTWL